MAGGGTRRETTGENYKIYYNAQRHSFFREREREWLDTSSIEGGGIIEDKIEHRDNTERYQIGVERREWVTGRETEIVEWHIQ